MEGLYLYGGRGVADGRFAEGRRIVVEHTRDSVASVRPRRNVMFFLLLSSGESPRLLWKLHKEANIRDISRLFAPYAGTFRVTQSPTLGSTTDSSQRQTIFQQ